MHIGPEKRLTEYGKWAAGSVTSQGGGRAQGALTRSQTKTGCSVHTSYPGNLTEDRERAAGSMPLQGGGCAQEGPDPSLGTVPLYI